MEGMGFLSSALQEGRFVCTAELVLGRDHNVADAEAFVRVSPPVCETLPSSNRLIPFAAAQAA